MRKFEKIVINTMSWLEFENIVKIVYGEEYDFVEMEYADNDSQHLFKDIQLKDLDSQQKIAMKIFLNGGRESLMAETLLQDLCNKGEIPEGNYLINVSW
jgi:hypothetical protein